MKLGIKTAGSQGEAAEKVAEILGSDGAFRVEEVDLSLIAHQGETQARAGISNDGVDDYRQMYADGMRLGHPIVISDTEGQDFYVVDGHHRIAAAREAELSTLECYVADGTLDDAKWLCCSANQHHGLRRTEKDIAHAVTMTMQHPRSHGMTYQQIADHVGCSRHWVIKVAKRLKGEGEGDEPESGAKSKKPPVDREGHTLPAHLVEAFKTSKAIHKIARDAGQTKNLVASLVNEPGGEYIDMQDIEGRAKDLAAGIRYSAPHAICPYCVGAGCKACRNSGVVTKWLWDAAPAEKQAAVAEKYPRHQEEMPF